MFILDIFKFWRWSSWVGALVGIVSGVILGVVSAYAHPPSFNKDRWDIVIYRVGGTLFVNGMLMSAVPLVFSCTLTLFASISDGTLLVRVVIKAFVYYVFSSSVAISVGLGYSNLIDPGAGLSSLGLEFKEENPVEDGQENPGIDAQLGVLYSLFPNNIIRATLDFNLLGCIVFASLCGVLISRLKNPNQKKVVLLFWSATYEIMISIVQVVMVFIPFGVAFLTGSALATTLGTSAGLQRLAQLGLFMLTVSAGLLTQGLIIAPLILICIARVNPFRHFHAVLPCLLNAFSTSSSAATLPLTLKCTMERAGVSSKIVNITVPVGATINMDGTALYIWNVLVYYYK
eukprot:GHVR01150511.1.p1 GENE.GHVR01150511.1~~GHVR01150511.1.p1  ORF type:complete len:345 (+),score=66.89 GHVR01150511.1:34-1068(+)